MGIFDKLFGKKKVNFYDKVVIPIPNNEDDLKQFLFECFMTIIVDGNVDVFDDMIFCMDNKNFYIFHNINELPFMANGFHYHSFTQYKGYHLKDCPHIKGIKLSLKLQFDDFDTICEKVYYSLTDIIIGTILVSKENKNYDLNL